MTDSNDPQQPSDEEQVWDQAFARAFGGPGSGPGSSVLERLGIAPQQRAGINLEDPDPSGAPVIKPGEESREVGSDRYQVVGEIARGGVGVVFKGRDMDLGRDVAMKVLRKELADRPGFVERFVEEAQVGGQWAGRSSRIRKYALYNHFCQYDAFVDHAFLHKISDYT